LVRAKLVSFRSVILRRDIRLRHAADAIGAYEQFQAPVTAGQQT
jgi:hypothetical protein